MERTAGGAIVLDGRRVRDEIIAELRAEIDSLGSPPVCLATVLVGGDRHDRVHVRMKHSAAAEAGMRSTGVELASTATQAEVESAVRRHSDDPAVHGVFVQLPLPDHIDPEPVLAAVPAHKDIDGLSAESLGRLVRRMPGHAPCTPLGVIELLDRYAIPTAGRRAVIVGRSSTVGLPLALLLLGRRCDATVTVADSQTSDLVDVCGDADILISAFGRPGLITAEHVAPGAVVVDAGATSTGSGVVGDVDFDAVQAVAGAIVPMPGGTGPVTIACLLRNTLTAAHLLDAAPPEPACGASPDR